MFYVQRSGQERRPLVVDLVPLSQCPIFIKSDVKVCYFRLGYQAQPISKRLGPNKKGCSTLGSQKGSQKGKRVRNIERF